jgi:hypothetical protein
MKTRPDRIADSHLSDPTPIGNSIARVMTCPKCQSTQMEEGEVVLKKPALDWLLFGLGSSDLCFRKRDERWSPVLELGQIRNAHRCENCGTLVLEMTGT